MTRTLNATTQKHVKFSPPVVHILPKPRQPKTKKTQKTEGLDNPERFTQTSYVCPFCGQPTTSFSEQLQHLAQIHPWYDLDVHQNIK